MNSDIQADDPVAVMDSGVGGLPYLERAAALLPNEHFVFFADRSGFPYGTKSQKEIEQMVVSKLSVLVSRFHPKAIVIACNTASQAALAAVRRTFPDISVVGTVPAIKPAAERTRTGVVGIMATEHAIADPYLDGLIARYAPNVKVLRLPAQNLVAFVEKRFIGSTAGERREALLPYVGPIVAAGADEIVLACTHFLHVADDVSALAAELSHSAGARIEVVDSRDGVARRLKTVLAADGMLAQPARSAAEDGGVPAGSAAVSRTRGIFLLSGRDRPESLYAAFAERYHLDAPELLGES